MSIRIKLVGCKRYSFGPKGEIFEAGYEYDLDDDKARVLLESNNEQGMPYFVRVERPAPAELETVTEEIPGEVAGSVKIIRRKAPKVANPRVKTSGDTAPLRDDAEPAQEGAADEIEEGLEV